MATNNLHNLVVTKLNCREILRFRLFSAVKNLTDRYHQIDLERIHLRSTWKLRRSKGAPQTAEDLCVPG